MRVQSSSSSLDRTPHIISVLVVMAAYIPTLVVFGLPLSSPTVIVLLAIGALYLFNGIVVLDWIERGGSLPLTLLYFLIQLTLALAAAFVGPQPGTMWLMALPLVSQAVIDLPRLWVWGFAVLTVGTQVILGGIFNGWDDTLVSLLAYASAVLFVIVFTQIYVREREARHDVERLAHRLEQVNDQLRAYAALAEGIATVEERNRLAREIHDSLGHFLTTINVQLEVARTLFDRDAPAAREAVEQAQVLTKEGLSEVRRSVAALRASPLEGRKLIFALEELLKECRAAGTLAKLTVAGEERELPPQVEHTLYRAVQEGLTNIHKHARAARVAIGMDYGEPDGVRLEIEDNGIGANASRLEEGFGLLGIRERVQLLGGELSLETSPSNGFRMLIRIPDE